MEVILKITDDFMHKSSLLRNEIKHVSTSQNDCHIEFKNNSRMKVVTATDSARGGRSNILIIDESRLIPQDIVDRILRPFNAASRQPGYLSKPEYRYSLQEMNKEFYMSSAWYQASEMFEKVKAYTANFFNPRLKYFICDLPYQMSIKEGLLMREAIENEKSEATFNDISFAMEREGIFFGNGQDSLFNFNVLDSRRTLSKPLFDLDFYRENNIKIPKKEANEKRILSIDVALLASRKHDNDASAFIINSAIPTSSNNFISNIVFIDTKEGCTTEELGIIAMRYFYNYECDYIVIDGNGIGMPLADYVMQDRYDPVYGITYPALDCKNNSDMSARCKVRGARKALYIIKGNAKLNNDMCLNLRSGFQNGYINLLINDTNIEEELAKDIKGYNKLSDYHKNKLKLPYLQTTFLINELINLEHDVTRDVIKVKEKYGMRKDRYSSLLYNYYVVQDLILELKPKTDNNTIIKRLSFKKGKRSFGL